MHAHVRPARHVNYSHELMVNVRGVHGHEAYCACGWVGRQWPRPAAAQAEGKWHYWTDHSREIAAHKREDVHPSVSAEPS